MTLQQWYNDWLKNRATTERVGQAFCNDFIVSPWPDLFYANHGKAIGMITEWLESNQYYDKLPQLKV